MAKLATPKKSTKPAAPKKPSTRSKTGNKACSDAASNWQLSLRGKSPLNPDTYQTLAKCRAMASTHRKADAYGRTGKLSDQGAAALRGRAQKRFDSNLITEKSRRERLQTLLSERAAKRGTAAAKTAPSQPSVTEPKKIRAITGQYHVTQNERNAIKQGVAAGATEWKTKHKHYKIEKSDDTAATLVITSKAREWNGNLSTDKQRVTISFDHPITAKPAPAKPAGVQRVLKGTTTKTDLNSGNYAAELKRKVDSHLAAGGSVSVNTMTRSTPITRPGDAGVLQVKGSSIYIAQGKSSGALVGSTLDNLAGQVGMPPRSMVPELRGTESRRQLAAKKFAERKKDRDMKTRGSQARMERAAFLREVRAGRQAAAKPRNIPETATTPKPGYSLGGKLAPGRGTEERNAQAGFIRAVRSGDPKKIVLAGNKRAKVWKSKNKYRDKSYSVEGYEVKQVTVGRNPSTATRVHVDLLQLDLRNKTRYRQKTGKLEYQAKPVAIGATFDANHTVGPDGKDIRGYVAKLTGTDPKYKLKREFLPVPAGGTLTVSSRGIYESRGPSTSVFAPDRYRNPAEKRFVLIGRKKVRELVDFQAERAVRLMERLRRP